MSPKTTSSLLAVLTLIIVVILFVLIAYLLQSTNRVLTSIPIFLTCPSGYCPTNRFNGEKRCPTDTTPLPYDPALEVCNSPGACESGQTPYALLPNGATSEVGLCLNGTQCRCLRTPQCSPDSLVGFVVTGGPTNYAGEASSRATYVQIPTPVVQPHYCGIKAYHLSRLSPGGCTFAIPTAPTVEEIRQCMALNPCLVGTLAYFPTTMTGFHLQGPGSALYTVPVACVSGVRLSSGLCPVESLPVWDSSRGAVVCHPTRV